MTVHRLLGPGFEKILFLPDRPKEAPCPSARIKNSIRVEVPFELAEMERCLSITRSL